jgi:hypothetical protein
MMPSGSVNIGVPCFGVRHPSMQVGEGAPRVAGARSGTAGRVGEGATLARGVKASLVAAADGERTDAKPPCVVSPSSSQPVTSSVRAKDATTNLRIGRRPSCGAFSQFGHVEQYR